MESYTQDYYFYSYYGADCSLSLKPNLAVKPRGVNKEEDAMTCEMFLTKAHGGKA